MIWDNEGNASVPFLQYSNAASLGWSNATLTLLDGTNYALLTKGVAAPPTGAAHEVVWNALADLGPGARTNLWLRARARDITLMGDWSDPTPYAVDTATDSDGDRLPDAWEMKYFGTLAYRPLDDPDHDGMNNLAEYLAGTDPTDPKSKLALDILVVGNEVRVSWPATTNATQYLQGRYRLDQSNGSWIDLRTNLPQVPNSGGYTDQLSTNPARFYRLRLEK